MDAMKERRAFEMEMRAEQEEQDAGNRYTVQGRAIVFGSEYDNGIFSEYIDAGALDDTDLRDVRLLVNHDTNGIPVARSRNNNEHSTMQLMSGPEGLDMRATLDVENNTQAAALYSAITRGDITGMSFAFTVSDEAWEDLETEHPTRHIRAIERVYELSAVTWPAYTDTSIVAEERNAEALESARAVLESARAKRTEDATETETAEEIRETLPEESGDIEIRETEDATDAAQLEARRAEEERKRETRAAVAAGAGTVIEEQTEERKKNMYTIESPEYRTAWLKNMMGRELDAEERTAVTATDAIPTETMNRVVGLLKQNKLLAKIDLLNIPGYLNIPVETTANAATWTTTSTDSEDVVGKCALSAYQLIKTVEVPATVEKMAVSAFEDYLVQQLTNKIETALAKAVVVGAGSGSSQATGISVTVSTTTGTWTKAAMTKKDLLTIMGSLGGDFQNGAIWIMPPAVFYGEVMALADHNNFVAINQGFDGEKLLGHDVILTDDAIISSADYVFYGDPKHYHMNLAAPIEVAKDTSVGFRSNSVVYRAATLADGKLDMADAFVKYTRAT